MMGVAIIGNTQESYYQDLFQWRFKMFTFCSDESLNDDGRKLVEKIEQCVRNFKREYFSQIQ